MKKLKKLNQEAILNWEREIEKAHPIISYFPRDQWSKVTKFNGWLPLPPAKPI